MIKDIFSLSNKKTFVQALLFYIFWAVGTLLFLIVVVDNLLAEAIDPSFGFAIGLVTAGAIPTILSIGIITSRKLSSTKHIIIALLSLTGLLFGIFIGLIPTIILSVMDNKS